MREALATAGTAFAAAALHLPQPFLAVLAAHLTAGIAFSEPGGLAKRIAAASAGSLCGLFILSAAPDQQWVSLPLFGLAAGLGTAVISRRQEPASAILFSMGLGGMFAAGIVHPSVGLAEGAAHAAALTIAVAATFLAGAICPARSRAAGRTFPWQVGIAGPAALVTSCATLPSQAVVMSIAAMTTALSLAPNPREIFDKLAGGVLGVGVSAAFLAALSGAGNGLGAFLIGMGLVMGGFEWMASAYPGRSSVFRQAGAMFAVAATMLPRPEASLSEPDERMAAVLLGLAAASLIAAAGPAQRNQDAAAQADGGKPQE